MIRNKSIFFLLTLFVPCLTGLSVSAAGNEAIVTSDIQYGEAVNDRGVTEDLLMDMYQPAVVADDLRPVVILVHGGGWAGGDKDDTYIYNPMSERFVDAGYVVFNMNYRLLTTYVPTAPDSAAADVLRALAFIKAKSEDYGVDTTKIFLGGDSAGGSAVVNAAYKNPTASGFIGLFDLWGGNAPDDLVFSVGGVWDQPIYPEEIPADAPPTIVIHGDVDESVPVQTSYDFVDQLESAGIGHEFHVLEGAGHWAYERLDDFVPLMIEFANTILAKQGTNSFVFHEDDFDVLAESQNKWESGGPGFWETEWGATEGINGSGCLKMVNSQAGCGVYTHDGQWEVDHRYKISCWVKATGPNAAPVIFSLQGVNDFPNTQCPQQPDRARWDTVTITGLSTEWQLQEAGFTVRQTTPDASTGKPFFGMTIWSFGGASLGTCQAGWVNPGATDATLIDNIKVIDLGSVVTGTTAEAVEPAPVKIYPNPTNGLVNVELSQLPGRHRLIRVYTHTGQLVLQKQALSLLDQIDLSEQAPGLYFLNISGGKSGKTMKVIVQ